MRISDWSSDVCSSDLVVGGACLQADLVGPHVLGVVLGVLRVVDRIGATVEAARLETAVRGHVAHDVVAERLLQAHRRSDGGPVVLGAEGDGFIERAERGAPERAGAAVRSEEHTSELQSLMRISYAVFC